MNGDGVNGGGGEDAVKMERLVFMWGYLPGASPQRSPLLSPAVVRLPPSIGYGCSWKDVCGGGCGFAMAISDSGKLITWGSTDDLGQSYVTSGKHGETPEPFPLPPEVTILKAAAGWAHCVSVTDSGEVYTWGWKECIPSGKVFGDPTIGGNVEKDLFERHSSLLTEQVSPRFQGSKSASGTGPGIDGKGGGEESTKRRRISTAKQAAESSTSGDENLSALPCLVTLNPGVRIASVAAGGRHTLALSDIGQVWGWGYGGEGQLGLGSRIRMVSSPHPVACIESSSFGNDRSAVFSRSSEGQNFRVPGNYIRAISCGGRHSAVVTDAGALLTFGWGLYGQCGQGSTDDELSPTCVSSLLGIRIEEVAAGLWHTVCTSADGDVYAFGGNQFGQLGTGVDQAETLPRLLDAPSLENVRAKAVSCGARHSAVVTEDSKAFCWGWNKYGQLGLGDVIDRNIPTQVPIDGLTSGLGAGLIACVLTFLVYKRHLRIKEAQDRLAREREEILNAGGAKSAKIFSGKQIKKATNNFSRDRLLGTGGYGEVYKGILGDGTVVAIKCAKLGNTKGTDQVLNEVRILCQVNHRSLVRLLGCCVELEQPLLVYEYIPNGTLLEHLQWGRQSPSGSKSLLTWIHRLRIAHDTAEGLAYLHSSAVPPIYHRDVKSSNILLDEKLNAKVSDFGLSRLAETDLSHISTCAQGTLGYLDPEYYRNYQLTDKSDVYSFGVVLLELLTSQKAIDFNREADDVNLAIYVQRMVTEERVMDVIDPALKVGASDLEMDTMKALGFLAVGCLEERRQNRPSMKEVVEEIEYIMSIARAKVAN